MSELELLRNASHHAYAFGQANMAQRAIEQLDGELAANLYVPLESGAARRILTALELIGERDTALSPALVELRDAVAAALDEAKPPAGEGV